MNSKPNQTRQARVSFQKLQSMVVKCRPTDVVSFSMHFFEDEKHLKNAHIAHSLRSLPYLLNNIPEFNKEASSIFCYEQQGNSNISVDLQKICALIFPNENTHIFLAFEILRKLGIPTGTSCDKFAEFVSNLRLIIFTTILVLWLDKVFAGAAVSGDGNVLAPTSAPAFVLTDVVQRAKILSFLRACGSASHGGDRFSHGVYQELIQMSLGAIDNLIAHQLAIIDIALEVLQNTLQLVAPNK